MYCVISYVNIIKLIYTFSSLNILTSDCVILGVSYMRNLVVTGYTVLHILVVNLLYNSKMV